MHKRYHRFASSQKNPYLGKEISYGPPSHREGNAAFQLLDPNNSDEKGMISQVGEEEYYDVEDELNYDEA